MNSHSWGYGETPIPIYYDKIYQPTVATTRQITKTF